MATKPRFPAFAERFTFAVKEKGLPTTQEGLGKKLGVTGTTARNWLHGDKLPSMGRAIEVAKRLDVNVEWLLTGNGPMRPSDLLERGDPRKRAMLELWERLPPTQRDALFRLLGGQEDQQAN